MSQPKRHHYVPRFYLKNFVNDKGYLWVYDRQEDTYSEQRPEHTAVQKDYYTIKDKHGNKDTEIEKLFSMIESKASAVIKKIVSGVSINQEDKDNLALFISCQMARVPEYEKRIADATEESMKATGRLLVYSVERAEEIIKQSTKNKSNKGSNTLTPQALFDFIQGGQYKISFSKEWSLGTMLQSAHRLSGYFAKMDWLILYAPNKHFFIISDNPYTLVPPKDKYLTNSGVGIITPGAQKVIPLSSKVSLVMGDVGGRYLVKNIRSLWVRNMNINSAQNSSRFIYAKDKELLESIVKVSRIKEIPIT